MHLTEGQKRPPQAPQNNTEHFLAVSLRITHKKNDLINTAQLVTHGVDLPAAVARF